MKPLDRVRILTPQGESGELSEAESGDYLFRYGLDATPTSQISLTMPVRDAAFISRNLHPVFQMNLPEGYVLEQLRNRLAKTTPLNPMLLMALTGSGSPIGRVAVQSAMIDELLGAQNAAEGRSLSQILTWDGTEDLFAELVDRYLLRTGISGVQPKVIVPEGAFAADPKATLLMPELIVKSGRADFPGLAINEYVCMDAARRAGMPVPEFHLSDNRQLFVMRRFDRDAEQRPIGFEDMAVLMGLGTEQKYDSSYEKIVRAIRLFCAPEHIQTSLEQCFDIVALSCMVGNGDAHLKNFGLLYRDPLGADAQLAPAYDIVNTTAYLQDDSLALRLAGSKSLFGSRLGILELAQTCNIRKPKPRLLKLIAAVNASLEGNASLAEHAPEVFNAIQYAVGLYAQTFCDK
ncbi:type II toxin-antitoxin system HipA family toxin [Pseudomonas sp. SLFW]|uniref:type II toxin-antitoxin system HipA family toxin n=1 Tax=Pseudomonas sp. SLFW TaxID=2683259 RepID=UPI00141250DB|nr:type II toxin-antitoxin system HipA family toxin [Pseudomonas sp. SLFW]NBB09777.1 type II toxin-antitoxin system HipA family toxin [Pseudomonas sp. SLFW]